MNAIEVSHLYKRYGEFALEDVSFTLPSGCIIGLVGENGAGKSTLIRLLMNATARDGGEIRMLGTDNRSPEFDRLKNDIGVVLDEAYFPETLTAKNVGAIMADTYTNWDAACYERFLERFSLPTGKPFSDYSRGMRMKLAIAVALSHAPRLLLCDEATSGLDPFVRDELLDLLGDYTRDADHSVLLSSHIVSDLEKICDYIALLHNGRLLLCQEKDQLLETYAKVQVSRRDFDALPEEAVVGYREGTYGIEALVRRAEVSDAFCKERAQLEEIILYLIRGGANR